MTKLITRTATIWLALIMLSLSTLSCSHIVQEINAKWPPKTSCDAQLASVRAATADLANFTAPASVYVGINGRDLDEQMRRVLTTIVPEIRDLRITTDQQEIVAAFSFDGKFLDGKVGAAGQAIIHGAMHVENTHLVIDPTFEQIKLTHVSYKKHDFPDESVLINLLNTALTTFINNINGALPLQKVQLSTQFIQDFDPKLLLKDQPNVETVYGKPIRLDIVLGHSSVFVDTDGVHVLAELINRLPGSTFITPTPSATTMSTCDPATFAAEYAHFRDQFVAKSATLGTPADLGWQQTGVAVSKSFLASAVNDYGTATCTSGNGNCTEFGLTYVVPKTYAHFKETITTDPAPDLKCGQNYPQFQPAPCNTSPCGFRDCPGSCGFLDAGCYAWKPVCETLKASEHLACETAEAARKAACEAGNVVQKGIYEAAKSANIAACNLNQGWLNDFANQNIGDIQGTLALDNSRVDFSLGRLALTPDFGTISIDSSLAARSDVLADIFFIPKDLGNILCQAAWNARVTTTVSGVKVTPTLNASITPTTDVDGGLVLTAHPDKQEFDLKLAQPPVLALLSQNPQVIVACVPAVVLGLSAQLVASVERVFGKHPTDFLTDTFRFGVDHLSIPIKLPPYGIDVPGVPDNKLMLFPTMRSGVVLFARR